MPSDLPPLKIGGFDMDGDLRTRVTSLRTIRSMEAASSIEIMLDDHDLAVTRSGLLTKAGRPTKRQKTIEDYDQAAWARYGEMRLTLEGWFTRLAGVQTDLSANETTIMLTFEDEIASLMRHQTAAIASTRQSSGHAAGQTRAQFIVMLLGIARKQVGYVRFFSPEESVRQDVEKPAADQVAREKGISSKAKLTIKGFQIDSAQRKNLEISLAEADKLRAGDKPTLAMLVSGIGESTFRAIPNLQGSGYAGVFQANPANIPASDTKQQAHYFLAGGKGFQQGGAIALAAAQPDLSEGGIATRVEGSRKPDSFYQVWIKEAQAILEAWGGTEVQYTVRERFSYRAGGKQQGVQHNYWDDACNLGREVGGWRLFVDSNTLFFVSDEWLFKQKPVFHVEWPAPGILSISHTADVGMPVSEIELTVNAPAWQRAPGSTVELENLGAMTGRWLIWSDEHDRLTDIATVTLRRPAVKRKEAASKTHPRSVSANNSDDQTDSGYVYPLGVNATLIGVPGAGTHSYGSDYVNWQSDNALDLGVPVGTPVYAVANAKVIKVGGFYVNGAGRTEGLTVTIEEIKGTHPAAGPEQVSGKRQWFYQHLRRRENLQPGDKVAAGQLLGESGSGAGVPHLHLGVSNGNPERLLDAKARSQQ